jgi:hypothetical protein
MKILTIIVTALLALGLLAYVFGDRLLDRRFRVVYFQWKLPPEKAAILSDSLAVEGIQAAFRASSRNPADWRPVPVAPQSAAANVLFLYTNTNEGEVMLTNGTTGKRLFARVELDVTNRVLSVDISRAK